MLDKFMSEHLYGKNIEIYSGGAEEERMQGKLVGSADGGDRPGGQRPKRLLSRRSQLI